MPDDAPQREHNTEQLLADRRRKLERLRDEFGLDPYGQRIDGLITLADAAAKYDEAADQANKDNPEVDERPSVRVAGRVMAHRVMGNLIFMRLRDATGDLQVAVSKKAVGQPAFSIAKMTDLSDLVAAAGPLAKTKTGEVTVWATPTAPSEPGRVAPAPELPPGSISASNSEPTPEPDQSASDRADTARLADPLAPGYAIAAKSLALPPGKYHGLTDPETRYRKRYLDLYANPEVMQTMQQRIAIIDAIRDYLRGRGFAEVETPMLQSIHGGAAARPFQTHHNALDMPLYLRIAPELYLKRLLVGGMPKVFEINRNFRNEGISPRHNPEFTMLEAYDAFGNWETMAELVEDMICTVAEKVCGGLILNRQDAKGAEKTINLTRPWRRVRMDELVEERTGWKFDKEPLPADHHLAAELAPRDPAASGGAKSVAHFQKLSPAEQLVEVYEKLIEPTLIDPCFVTHVPSVIIPLAKKNKDDDYFADVYELAINGVEISPGYTELNDPAVQEANFRGQVGEKAEQQQVDEDFLEALRVGMPPAGGLGLGIDRLVMMLLGAESIRDVILFPLMRPVEKL
ncbi:MAG: lysine--tRNA ligase [Planctomycetes bacterium]|jgi:lysyl-tRNA synthetase class 2|nr:lysine--tRNA ligase [Planctomycetota bacterium]